MAVSVGGRARTNDSPSWLIDQHAVHGRLNANKLGGDFLPKSVVVPQLLGLHALHNLLGAINQGVKIGVGMEVEVAELLEELGQIADCQVAKHLPLAGAVIREAFGEVGDY